jgi:hypothetical protein
MILALFCGCATTHAGTTWEEDRAEGVATNNRGWPADPKDGAGFRRPVSIGAHGPPTENYVELATKMELAILQFTSARRSRAAP